MKLPFIPLVAVATGVALGGTAQAQNAPTQRGYQYFAPGRSFGQNTPANNNLQQPTAALPGAAAAPAQVPPTARYPRPTGPGSWGVRYAAGYGYPASLFGQFVQNPGYQGPGFGAAPNYGPQEVAQGAAPATPPAPGYANPQLGVPQPSPGSVPGPGGMTPTYGNRLTCRLRRLVVSVPFTPIPAASMDRTMAMARSTMVTGDAVAGALPTTLRITIRVVTAPMPAAARRIA